MSRCRVPASCIAKLAAPPVAGRPMRLAGMLAALLACCVARATTAAADPGVLLDRADAMRLGQRDQFNALLDQAERASAGLTPQQRLHLAYLRAWQAAYLGHYAQSIDLLKQVAKGTDATLRMRANATMANMYSIGDRYVEAYTLIGEALNQRAQSSDAAAREQTLNVAIQLYNMAGQYPLAIHYADQLIASGTDASETCKASYSKVVALYELNQGSAVAPAARDALDRCTRSGTLPAADAVRVYLAKQAMRDEHPAEAIAILSKHLQEVRSTQLPSLIAVADAAMARAYMMTGNTDKAVQSARAALATNIKDTYTQAQADAYRVLYEIAKGRGDIAGALAAHEQLMAATDAYLDKTSARALAYQTVAQRVLAKKQQIDSLNKQNQILQLQRTLDRKTLETSRLYIALLALAAAAIALLAFRLRRSQMHFKRMAHRDGLTGALNRQQFVTLATSQLQHGQRAGRDICVAILDMDHFKPINDQHGHAVGDRVLQLAVQACQSHLRASDLFGRLGGEEFGILLPDCSLAQSRTRIEQIRAALAAQVAGGTLASIPISASFGIAHTSVHGYELGQLLIHADAALYRSKHEGRNRVSLASRNETGFDWPPAPSSADPDQPMTLQ